MNDGLRGLDPPPPLPGAQVGVPPNLRAAIQAMQPYLLRLYPLMPPGMAIRLAEEPTKIITPGHQPLPPLVLYRPIASVDIPITRTPPQAPDGEGAAPAKS